LRGFDTAAVKVLRFSSVYGTRLRLDDGEATIIAKLAACVNAGQAPTLFEDGAQIRDWVYVGDVVGAILALVDGRSCGPITNVCSGVPTTLAGASEHLSDVIGISCRPKIVGGYRPGDMRHCLGDPRPLSALLGREPIPFSAGAHLAFGELRRAAPSPTRHLTGAI
jgi:dTDP-L-rhamnose 4-epimerase